jgi:SHS2 domain-containing protein
LKYTFLPHTGDIRVKVEGESLKTLYMASMLALASILKPELSVGSLTEEIKIWIEFRSVDRTALLIDFLSEVLTESLSRGALFTRLEDVQINETKFGGWICGSLVEQSDDEVKAVTYHGAELIKNEIGNWETSIVFDI